MTDSNKLISVIIPAHRRPDNLFKLLDSLEFQSFPHEKYEVIVVPSPRDESIEQFSESKYKMNIKFVIPPDSNDAARNVSAKRNLGAKNATGSWLAFTDDDCLADKNWLQEAAHLFSEDISAIEGITKTPEDSPKTLTYKGLQRLAKPGGYQTCNIFYNKIDYDQVGGFDETGFPWYLEDTDMAWSILDLGKSIVFSDKAIIFHPVNPAAPWRNFHEAKNTGRKLLLFKKHPDTYTKTGMKIFRWSHYVYFLLNVVLFLSLFYKEPNLVKFILGCYLFTLGLHSAKLFFGYLTTPKEIFQMLFFTAIWPMVALFAVIKDSFRYRMNPLRVLLLLLP